MESLPQFCPPETMTINSLICALYRLKVFVFFFFPTFIVCVCLCVSVWVLLPRYTCAGQRTALWESFSPSTVRVLGSNLGCQAAQYFPDISW